MLKFILFVNFLVEVILNLDLNSNDLTNYNFSIRADSKSITNRFKFNNLKLINLDLKNGKIFKTCKPFKYKDNVVLKLFEFNTTNECNSNINNLYKYYFENKEFQPNYPYSVSDGSNVVLACPLCNLNREKLWVRKPFISPNRYDIFNFDSNKTHRRILVGLNYSLMIKAFQLTDSGMYFCVDKTQYENLTSKSTNINKTLIENMFNFKLDKLNKNLTNSIDTMSMIRIYLFHSLETYTEKRLIASQGLSQISKYKMLKPNDKSLTHVDNESNLKFYTLWTNWGICKHCTLNKRHRRRNSECRVVYFGTESVQLIDLNRTFYPLGLPCSYLSTYYNLISYKLFSRIPYDLVELDNCVCQKKDGLYEDEYINDNKDDDEDDKHKKIVKQFLKEFEWNLTMITIRRYTGDDITLKCHDLEYHNVVWKKNNAIIDHKDKSRMSMKNMTHLLSSELVLKRLNITDRGLYRCYKNKKSEPLLVIKLDIQPLHIKSDKAKLEDNYELMQPTLFMIAKFITGIALFSVINQAVVEYFRNRKLNEKTNKQKKECYFIQKFLRINLVKFEKSFK